MGKRRDARRANDRELRGEPTNFGEHDLIDAEAEQKGTGILISAGPAPIGTVPGREPRAQGDRVSSSLSSTGRISR